MDHKRETQESKPSPLSVGITIRWQSTVLHVAHLTPPRSFCIGEEHVDYILPAAALGHQRAPLVLIGAGAAGDEKNRRAVSVVLLPRMVGVIHFVGEPARTVAELIDARRTEAWPDVEGARILALPPGSRALLEMGPFEFEIEVGEAARLSAARYRINKRSLPFHVASAALHAGILAALAIKPSALTEEQESLEQAYRMQQYLTLSAAAEREVDELNSSPKSDGKGGDGRAKGEEGTALDGRAGGRYGVQGPSQRTDAHLSRAAALRAAAEFGMIGVLHPSVPEGSPPPSSEMVEGPGDGPVLGGAPLLGGPDSLEEIFEAPNHEEYTDYGVNPIVDPAKDRVSTFAIDVDTGSYAIARRKLLQGSIPPREAIRAEEFLNSFNYDYAGPEDRGERMPFTVHLDAAPSPFTNGHHLLRVGVQGKRVEQKDRSPVHLVYLVDTSGSMQSDDKIGLAKQSLKLLTSTLKHRDTVALCTYAGSVREVLPPTGVADSHRILAAIDDLTAAGSTAMESGIDLAYQLAERTLVPGEVNRVIILSDGDANVGATSHEDLVAKIRRYKDKGITLSTIGFGDGNYKDTVMERLANQGNGNYTYIDDERQARKVFGEQASGMLEVIARDVKIQVEFDPRIVRGYRLIGYENRDVADEHFRDDTVDGGEIGAGHSVTAIYDVVLKTTQASPITVRLRHKGPFGSEIALESLFVMQPSDMVGSFDRADASFRFATAVAGFAEILRESPHASTWRLAEVESIARAAAGDTAEQMELVDLVRVAKTLTGESRSLQAKRGL
jgi:Ca-activated chloride channel family protein